MRAPAAAGFSRSALLALACALAGVPGVAGAQGSGGGAAMSATAGTASPATAPIVALQQTLSQLRPNSFAADARLLGPVLDQAFDLEAILKASVGLSYDAIPPAQKAKLLGVFRAFTVASYVGNFAGSHDRFTVSPEVRALGAEQVVRTGIVGDGGTTTRVDYVMRQEPAGFRAVDVLLDGTISRVAVQRSDFRSVLAAGGPDALIRKLSDKVTALSDGQMSP